MRTQKYIYQKIFLKKVAHHNLHTHGNCVFLCSPACPKQPRTSYPFCNFFIQPSLPESLVQPLIEALYSFFTIGDVITNTTELGYCSPPERDNLVYKTGCEVIKHPYERTECYCKGPLCNINNLVPE